jgi:hypothetical protein
MIYNIVYTSILVTRELNKAMGHRQSYFYCFLIGFTLTCINIMLNAV